MNEQTCSVHDVTKTARNLVSYGATLGQKFGFDSITKNKFSLQIATFSNWVIKEVHEGTLSAWEGMQALLAEHEALRAKAWFYTKNGIGVAAGALQIKAGIAITGATAGAAVVPGAFLMGHGANNMYEGGMNIYNGPNAPSAEGPMKTLYQKAMGDVYKGNMAYYSADLGLSAISMGWLVRKPGSVQLFRRDSKNYEMTYKQTGTLALFFEAVVDGLNITSMCAEVNPN